MIPRPDTPLQAADWLRASVHGKLTADSRQVAAGDGFIAWPGAATDGRSYVTAALAAGATACLVEAKGVDAFKFNDARVVAYADLKSATGPIAAHYYQAPSTQLDVIAVTGTNGKTSSTWLLAQALTRLGKRCGVVGTLGIGEPGALVANGLTTPDPVLLQAQLRSFVDLGFAACAIEASSIGLVERRLDAVAIRIAVFTNFTQDHLDFHGSMQAYWDAKRALFEWPGLQAAVVNIDDAKGAELAASLLHTGLAVWTFSLAQPSARIRASRVRYSPTGMLFDISENSGPAHTVSTSLIGDYNVSNLLGVVATLRAMNFSLVDIAAACSQLAPVPGRMELIATDHAPLIVIDYAHTPDALEKVLVALKPVAVQRKGQIWCVFGCGGERDARKRPLMATLAEQHADRIVITNDNPRCESPQNILNDILRGFSGAEVATVEPDRATAIAHSIKQAAPHDIVLIAGKGHEPYQESGGQKIPFSDRAQSEIALASYHATLHVPAGSAA